jgi:aspartate aminotransferase
MNPVSDTDLYNMVTAFKERRDYLLEILRESPGLKTNIPDGAFYVFADCTEFFGKADGENVIKDANDLSFYLMYNAHVATVSGTAFGDPDCIRFSYAIDKKDLREAVTRIRTALEKLS